jgi:hypothetical protein
MMGKSFCSALVLLAVSCFSCKDTGSPATYLDIVDISPAPNATGVDKAVPVSIRFSNPIDLAETGKIQIRYVHDTSAVPLQGRYGLIQNPSQWLSAGPFIWKPGRTVEVTIPSAITDAAGNGLRKETRFTFTIAEDTTPFDLVTSVPASGDTIAIHDLPLGILRGTLHFSDYVYLRDSVLSLDPRLEITIFRLVAVDGPNGPSRSGLFAISDLQPNTTYTIVVPATITDYEGEHLAGEHQIVFHTIP